MRRQPDPFTRQLLTDAGIKSGMRVLDVGCGYGDVTQLAASMVGEDGEVVGVEQNPAALEVASAQLDELSIKNVELLSADVDEGLSDIGEFDAIIGRRVLMYLPDPAATIRRLTQVLRPSGCVAFQELDLSMLPTSSSTLPLHMKVQSWLTRMVEHEGADLQMGMHLYQTFADAGLKSIRINAETVVQTPDQPSELATIVRAVLPRILESNAATEAEVHIDTLEDRLSKERSNTGETFISDMKFGAIGIR